MKRKHHDLFAWQRGIALVKEIYRINADFPREELFGLTSQMRRAAVSIPCNIAEGAGRNTDKEFIQFLGIARGSLSELETLLILARELGYIVNEKAVFHMLEDLFGLIGGLMNSIKARTRQ